MKKRAIRIPLESKLYLLDQSALQRGGHHISERTIEREKRNMERSINQNGFEVFDGSFGGAIGDPKNSYEEGRWTNWSIDDMKKMLDEQNLPYTDIEPIDVIDVALW